MGNPAGVRKKKREKRRDKLEKRLIARINAEDAKATPAPAHAPTAAK